MTSRELIALHQELTAMRTRLGAIRRDAYALNHRTVLALTEAASQLSIATGELHRTIGEKVVEEDQN